MSRRPEEVSGMNKKCVNKIGMNKTGVNKRLWGILAFSLCLLFLFSLFLLPQRASGEAKQGKRQALFIIAHRGFRDEEFTEPKAIVERAGVKVLVASSQSGEAHGSLGLKYKPDLLLSDVTVDDYDMIVFIGGPGSTEYYNDKKALAIAKQAAESKKVIGAICIAPVILANAGILKGKKATVFQYAADLIRVKGAEYTGKDLERDGLIITASGPHANAEFGKALIDALQGPPPN